jgi:hypothetical protein
MTRPLSMDLREPVVALVQGDRSSEPWRRDSNQTASGDPGAVQSSTGDVSQVNWWKGVEPASVPRCHRLPQRIFVIAAFEAAPGRVRRGGGEDQRRGGIVVQSVPVEDELPVLAEDGRRRAAKPVMGRSW